MTNNGSAACSSADRVPVRRRSQVQTLSGIPTSVLGATLAASTTLSRAVGQRTTV